MKSLKKNTQKEKQEKKNKKGISLIVLIVTIVVIIILVATVLYNITDGKLFGVANESVFKNDLRVIEEEFEMFVQTKATQSVGKFEIESLNAADNGLTYNTKTNENEKDIYDVIPTAKKGYYGEFEIIKGELYYKGDVEQKLIWAKELGIGIIPYEIVDGVLISANSNLLLLDSTGTVRIPYNVTKIDSGVFNNLEGLKRVIIPGSVKEIGMNAFSNNTSLQEVIMEDGVEIIGESAFSQCNNLETVKMEDSIKEIDSQAFYYCTNLKNINLSKSIKEISYYCFSGCISLENIIIPEGVEIFSSSCFSYCTNLKNINLPSSLKELENGVFGYDRNLNQIIVESKNFKFEDGKLLDKAKKILYFVISNEVKDDDELTIDEGIESIMAGALSNYDKIKILNLPSTLKEFNANKFIYSKDIEKINIAEGNQKYSSDGVNVYDDITSTLIISITKEKSVTIRTGTKTIGTLAFSKCTNLETITLNNDLGSIESQAFLNTKLQNIYIPASVTNINPLAFYQLNLNSLVIDVLNKNYTSDDKFLYNKDKTSIITHYKTESSVVIPDGIEKIEFYAFHGKSEIKEIIIPESVKEIGQSFNYCSGLTNITIPNSVEKINNNCFKYTNNLTQINVDNKKDSISEAPWGCPYGMRAVNWLR